MRTKAVNALQKIRDPRAVEPLIAVLKDEDSYVRRSVASALGHFGDERAVLPLIDALQEKHTGIRRSAVSSLGDLGDERAVAPLVSMLTDDDGFFEELHVCTYAADALLKIGTPDALAAVAKWEQQQS